jgi:hypothetical protein
VEDDETSVWFVQIAVASVAGRLDTLYALDQHGRVWFVSPGFAGQKWAPVTQERAE